MMLILLIMSSALCWTQDNPPKRKVIMDEDAAGQGGTDQQALLLLVLFFFSSRRRHTRFDCDWSSDVCSSDLDPDSSQAGLRRADRSVVSRSAAAAARGDARAGAATRRRPARSRRRVAAGDRARHRTPESRQGAVEPAHARAVARGVPARHSLVLSGRKESSHAYRRLAGAPLGG